MGSRRARSVFVAMRMVRDRPAGLKTAGVIEETTPERPFGHVGRVEPVPGWALGQTATNRTMSDREQKLTAAMYAQIPDLVAHVRRTGRLPAMSPGGGMHIGLRLLVERRGIDLEPSEDERAVLDVIARTGDVPAGCAVRGRLWNARATSTVRQAWRDGCRGPGTDEPWCAGSRRRAAGSCSG
jgi:hypothetical protein